MGKKRGIISGIGVIIGAVGFVIGSISENMITCVIGLGLLGASLICVIIGE